MATLQQWKEGIGEAWDHLLEGWRKLYQQASGALTRFKSRETAEQSKGQSVTLGGWGVLACEVIDEEKQIIVRMEAPGMEKQDFRLEVVSDYLVVRGEKQMKHEHRKGNYYISECAYGGFERAVPLPHEVDADKATAGYRRGVLTVKLPKIEPRRQSRVQINTE